MIGHTVSSLAVVWQVSNPLTGALESTTLLSCLETQLPVVLWLPLLQFRPQSLPLHPRLNPLWLLWRPVWTTGLYGSMISLVDVSHHYIISLHHCIFSLLHRRTSFARHCIIFSSHRHPSFVAFVALCLGSGIIGLSLGHSYCIILINVSFCLASFVLPRVPLMGALECQRDQCLVVGATTHCLSLVRCPSLSLLWSRLWLHSQTCLASFHLCIFVRLGLSILHIFCISRTRHTSFAFFSHFSVALAHSDFSYTFHRSAVVFVPMSH